MNILYFSPSNAIGGAELSLLEIIKKAKNARYKVYVALPPPKRGDLTYFKMLKNYCDSIYVVRPMLWHVIEQGSWLQKTFQYLYSAYKSGWHVIPTLKLIYLIKKHKIDIVHTNTIMAIEGVLASKISGVKHIWHIREAIGYDSDAVVRFPFQKYPGLFSWMMGKLSSQIIVNSNFTKSLAKLYFQNNNLTVIYNSLPNKWFAKKSNGPKNSKIVIGVVANVTSKIKNHKLVVELGKLIKEKHSDLNVLFYIYGALPNNNDAYYSDLLNRIKSSKLEDLIIFKGVDHNENIYNTIDLLFHPFNKEGFGRIYIEAMGKGIPVVAVKGGGADELINNGITGFKVSEDKPEHIIDIIYKLVKSKKVYNQISSNGFKYSFDNFNNSIMWDKVSKFYKEGHSE